jgi:hypothetical protein
MEHNWLDVQKVICLLWSYTDNKQGVRASFKLLGCRDIDISIKYSDSDNEYVSRISIGDEEISCFSFDSPKEAAIDIKSSLRTIISNIVNIL